MGRIRDAWYGRVAAFPDRLDAWEKPKVLTLTPEDAPVEVMRLSYPLEQAILPFGRDEEHKEFRPHLTLTRDYRSTVPEASSAPEFFLRADRFALYESQKGQYRMIAERPLTQPAELG
jgi:2'-5' RNA ligase